MKPTKADFPEILTVTASDDDNGGFDYFGNADVRTDAAEDGDLIAVYELKTVSRVKVSRELIPVEG